MDVLRRVLLIILGALLVLLAVFVGYAAFNEGYILELLTSLQFFFTAGNFFLCLGCALLLLFVGVVVLFAGVAHVSPPNHVSVANTNGGTVSISLEAIDRVVRHALAQVADVSEIETKLQVKEGGVEIELHLSLPHGVAIPDLSSRVEEKVLNELQAVAGCAPRALRVVVDTMVDKPQPTMLPSSTTERTDGSL